MAPEPPAARPRRLSTAAKRRLRQPLAPDHVSERSADGEVVRYLAGWRAIQLANAIFGEDRWGAEVVGEVAYRPLPAHGRRGPAQQAGVYTATVRVTVDGCPPHSDVGVAAVVAQTPEEHATACKAAVTDGLKRALRHFGAAFGNELSADAPGGDEAAGETAALQRRLLAIGELGGSDEARTREWVEARYGCPLAMLDRAHLRDAIAHLERGVDRRHGPAQAA